MITKLLKINLDALTLDDLIKLDEAPTLNPRLLRSLLANVLEGWTEEDAGKLTMGELMQVNQAIGEAMSEYREGLIPPESSGG